LRSSILPYAGTLIAINLSVTRLSGIRPTSGIEWTLKPAPVMPAGTIWTLAHDTEGVVQVLLGPHPHGFELRLMLNNRFLRSRVHRELAGVLADAADTHQRFAELGFEEPPARFVH
jgi:hypothetical protein